MRTKKGKTAIIGCGLEAHNLYYRMLQNGDRVDFFVDNYRTDDFWGNKICSIETIKDELGDIFFYIPSRKNYRVIREQLNSYGLTEFDDYSRGGVYKKEVICLNANCYGPKLTEYLETNREFCQDYYIYDSVPIYSSSYDFELEKCLSNCDIYLCQDLRKDNPYGERFSLERTVPLVRSDCKKIIIPNLVGMGEIYYPQAYVIDGSCNDESGLEFGLFPQGDYIVDKLHMEGRKTADIIEYIHKNQLFDMCKVAANIKKLFDKFIEREKQWDIKIVEYIRRNYKDKKLFYDLYHPSNEVYVFMAKQILRLLGIKNTTIKQCKKQNEYELPIYAEVGETLGFTFDYNSMIRNGSMFKLEDSMCFEQWIKEYVSWCYERNSR